MEINQIEFFERQLEAATGIPRPIRLHVGIVGVVGVVLIVLGVAGISSYYRRNLQRQSKDQEEKEVKAQDCKKSICKDVCQDVLKIGVPMAAVWCLSLYVGK